ncbi:MAG: hypothetical protein ABIR70_18850 [Bryobacteraceae bacterium]
MLRRGLAGGLLILVVAAGLAAKETLLECGSYVVKAQEEAFLHLRHSVRRATSRLAAADVGALRAARANQDVGEIAVIGSGNGVVGLRNPFDLVSKTVSFTPDIDGYKVETGSDTFDTEASIASTKLALEDDDTKRITLPFPFPFYGSTYNEAYVNSNGSLSFTAGDLDYSGSFGHFAAGPPAIAGLFTDLNPPSSTNGVRVLQEPGRVVLTWDNVLLATDNFFSAGQTFQIRIYPTGKVELTYTSVSATLERAVVGLNPGGLKPVSLVDLTATTGIVGTGIAESFTSTLSPEIDMMAAAQRFYQSHDDAYDYLVVYNAMGIPADAGVVAYEVTTRSKGDGYGDTPTETGLEYGSKKHLQAVLNLGPTIQYPTDPFGTVASRGTIGDTPVSILAHEAGHLFLALVSVPSPTNSAFPPMLGAALAHWAFPYNTDASVMEGNRIVDAGPSANPRYRTTATVQRYSEMDQYLMGFREPKDVPPSFAVLNSGYANSKGPQTGITFNGTRLGIPVEDVIKASGRRIPDATVAQRNFRMAFVVVVDETADIAAGSAAAAAIAQVDSYRTAFETFYTKAADFRATISTSLRRNIDLSLAPAAGVALNGTGTASIELATATAVPIRFTIETPAGVVRGPGTVTIPVGGKRADFTLDGVREGVEELRAVPDNPAFHPAIARVQVSPQSELRVMIASGDKQPVDAGTLQPIVARVVDKNKLPYANQTVQVAVSGGGSVSPLSAVTNAFGEASFTWTPASGSFNRLTFTIPGVPGSTGIATALGAPEISFGGVVNGASFIGPFLAPGGFASIFGGSLAGGATARVTSSTFPTTLGGVRVTMNGLAVPLTYVSDSQINFVVPATILPGAVKLVVTSPLGSSGILTVIVAGAAPGIFFNSATGEGAVFVGGTAIPTSVRPGKPGEFLEIYGTGLGMNATSEVKIGGVTAQVTFSGPTVTQGLQQVNVRVPSGIPPGTRDLVLTTGGIQANTVRVQVVAGP